MLVIAVIFESVYEVILVMKLFVLLRYLVLQNFNVDSEILNR